jgi:hypothetical protein
LEAIQADSLCIPYDRSCYPNVWDGLCGANVGDMNVKTAAHLLGKSQTQVLEKCRALFEKHKGQYHLSDSDLEQLKKALAKAPRKSVVRDISIAHRISAKRLHGFVCRLNLSFKKDKDKIILALKLRRTGLYTLKGIIFKLNEYGKEKEQHQSQEAPVLN